MITLKNVSKSFGEIRAVDNVSFEVQPGEVVGFLGPNGAGKSTTMRVICGYLPPTQGSVMISGINVLTHPVEAKKKVGYLPESAALYAEMSTADFLRFMGKMRGLDGSTLKERVKIVTRQCQIQDVLLRKIADLSKGFRQRVGLAQALLHNPDILILDEPTVGLDPNQIVEIRSLIREIGKQKTILLSTHILQEVSATCQRVIIIHRGRIAAQGTPQDLIEQEHAQTAYRVRVKADLAVLKEQIARSQDFQNLDVIKSENGFHLVRIYCGNKDAGENIYNLSVKNNWSLTELVREQQTLEDVFKQLTQ